MLGYQRNLFVLSQISILFLIILACFPAKGQDSTIQSPLPVPKKTVVAGPQYGTSSFHQWLWGKHYRTEWTTPVKVNSVNLDTIDGGLTAYDAPSHQRICQTTSPEQMPPGLCDDRFLQKLFRTSCQCLPTRQNCQNYRLLSSHRLHAAQGGTNHLQTLY